MGCKLVSVTNTKSHMIIIGSKIGDLDRRNIRFVSKAVCESDTQYLIHIKR